MSLSQKAILASLRISQWTGRKLDSRATGKVEENFATERRVGNYTKKLLPNAVELEKVKAISAEARKFFTEQTLPWLSDGTRIVSSKNYFDLTTALRQRRDAFDAAVKQFLASYEKLKGDAKIKLGALFRESDYPTAYQLSGAFSFDLTFLPLPEVADFRTEVLDSERDEFLKKMSQIENEAVRECYSRLSEVVSNAVDRLNKPDAVFRDSLIENIKSICDLLPKLNATDDATLETMRKDVEKAISTMSPETLRENKTERETAAKRLADLDAKMSQIMGGLK